MQLTVLFVLAALELAAAHGHEGQLRPAFRKTLSFGPELAHGKFESVAHDGSAFAATAGHRDNDPFTVARAFVAAAHPGAEYDVRSDSYTDARTGVSHVYVTQRVNGVVVDDGRINLNIKDGRVLSYGDSFFVGTAPATVDSTPLGLDALASTQLAFCATLDAHTAPALVPQAGSQVPLRPHERSEPIHPSLADTRRHNCARIDTAAFAPAGLDSLDTNDAVRAAALSFMLHATPSDSLAEDIAANFNAHLNNIQLSVVTHLNGRTAVTLTNVPGAVKPVLAHLAYIQTPSADGKSSDLNIVYKLEVEMENNWYDAAVSAVDPRIIFAVTDWVSDSPFYPQPEGPALPRGAATAFTDHPLSSGGPHSYNVFPWGINDPSEGKRSLIHPQPDSLASPVGWHSFPSANDPSARTRAPVPRTPVYVNYTTTFGNNVFAQENWEGRSNWIDNYRPISSTKWPSLSFDYKYKPETSDDPLAEAQSWINTTITQLFYTGNLIHDLLYRYGFDEVSGNFQQYNFGRGGAENDAVIMNAQDGSGYNNANFATPPDGSNGRCRMYIWNTATPYRDGDLEAGIVIHEEMHGTSTRLTGGPADSSCLGFGESGGMGEGWGDFLATMIRSTETYSDYPMGSWAANTDKGIRNFPYSLNFTTNPSTYKTLDKGGYWGVHAIGEVWAEILFTVAQKFVTKHGFSSTLFPPPVDSKTGRVAEPNEFFRPRPRNSLGEPVGPLVPAHGNTLIVQLVLDGMKLQPCRPSFFQARDAIIQADQILTGGENLCLLWEGFSERGLGIEATVIGKTPWGGGIRKDDFTLPTACRKTPEEGEPAPEEPEDAQSWWL